MSILLKLQRLLLMACCNGLMMLFSKRHQLLFILETPRSRSAWCLSFNRFMRSSHKNIMVPNVNFMHNTALEDQWKSRWLNLRDCESHEQQEKEGSYPSVSQIYRLNPSHFRRKWFQSSYLLNDLDFPPMKGRHRCTFGCKVSNGCLPVLEQQAIFHICRGLWIFVHNSSLQRLSLAHLQIFKNSSTNYFTVE